MTRRVPKLMTELVVVASSLQNGDRNMARSRASLPTRSSSKNASALTKRLMVTHKVLSHMMKKGALARMAADGCCKPDGGTCCVNKR
jgi:hypothetical protein